MRAVLLALVSCMTCLAGCSGAASTDFFQDGAQSQSQDQTSPAPKTTTPTQTTPKDAATPAVTPDPNAPDPTQPPLPACTAEVEPNNRESQATAFTSCIAGTLTEDEDKDYVTFDVPAGNVAQSIRITNAAGNTVRVQVSSDDHDFMVQVPDLQNGVIVPAVGGGRFVIEITRSSFGGGNSKASPWELHLSLL